MINLQYWIKPNDLFNMNNAKSEKFCRTNPFLVCFLCLRIPFKDYFFFSRPPEGSPTITDRLLVLPLRHLVWNLCERLRERKEENHTQHPTSRRPIIIHCIAEAYQNPTNQQNSHVPRIMIFLCRPLPPHTYLFPFRRFGGGASFSQISWNFPQLWPPSGFLFSGNAKKSILSLFIQLFSIIQQFMHFLYTVLCFYTVKDVIF